MSKQPKKIGVLTSGGDAPGMNAAVRSVVRTALSKGMEVIGFERGYNGLINGHVRNLTIRDVSGIINRGGTILYTARCDEFRYEEGIQKGIKTARELGVEGIVTLGGDGSFRGARDLSQRGMPCVGIPCTIDNDISASNYTIGYDTAINTAIEMVDKLRDTAQSHDRCSVVEVMGKNAGHIALQTGIACGATSIIVPELEYNFEKDILERIDLAREKTGKKHFIIIVAEGIGHVDKIANDIQLRTGIDSRHTVLGHVQRGGSPTARDRIVATEMGFAAVELISKGIGNRVVAMEKEKIVDYDIFEALAMEKSIDMDQYRMAHEISF